MDPIITIIHACMQRGERPLSIVDLVERELITLSQAAWLVSRVEAGSSWLIGAIPGHAGKTTLMSSLLVFLPAGQEVTLTRAGMRWESFGPGSLAVSEEISSHGREVYLWGADVRGFTAIPSQGGRIAATIHANSLDGVREQIVQQCGAGESGMAAFQIFVPIDVEFAPESEQEFPIEGHRRHRTVTSRRVDSIHYFEHGGWKSLGREAELTKRQEEIAEFLRACLVSGTHTCEELREAWLARS